MSETLTAPPPPTPAPSAPAKAAPAPAKPSAPARDPKEGFMSGLKAAAEKGPNLKNVEPQVKKAFEADLSKPTQPSTEPPKAPEKAPQTPAEPPKTQGEQTPPAQEQKAPVEAKGEKKPGAWQLKERYEKLAREYEKRAVEAESKLAQMGDADKLRQRAEQAETRLKELDEHIRYVDYSKSEEFKTKYQQPYEEAWTHAVNDLKELQVSLPDGNQRTGTVQDLLALANLPLGEARRRANDMFGEAADDVMAHYRKVRELSSAQTRALEEARKNGAERQTQQTTAQKTAMEQTAKLFHQFREEDSAKYDFLKPKEGDEQWNSKLKQATDYVDSAFSSSSSDPRLTPEQRAEIVRKHASVRGRAIGFTTLKMENTRLKNELAERDKIIAQYKGGEPNNGQPHGGEAASTAPIDAMERFRQKAFSIAGKNPKRMTP